MKPMQRGRAICLCLVVLLLLPLLPLCSAVSAPPYKGLDVSRWQGTVNWTTVKNSGVDFAILRCFAYRKDATFEANYAGATAQGIPVGAYVYMYALSETEAVVEAQNTLAALDGKPLTLPLFLDVEDEDVKALGKEKVTDLMLIELAIFEAAGYPAGIYTSLSHKSTDMDASRLNDCCWWIARWTCYTTDENPRSFTFADQSPSGSKKPVCDLWQFSNGGKGSTYGVSSDYVDLNYCYTNLLKDGPHSRNEHRYQAQLAAPTCTAPGTLILTCADCGDVRTSAFTKAALGHLAVDANGVCPRCGQDPTAPTQPTDPTTPTEPTEPTEPPTQPTEDPTPTEPSGGCPWCGGTHEGMFGWLIQIIHNVLAAILGARY